MSAASTRRLVLRLNAQEFGNDGLAQVVPQRRTYEPALPRAVMTCFSSWIRDP